jgi:very-short-patch-repair endonuclease
VLAVGHRATLSHESAARFHDLISLPSHTIHISTPRQSHSRPGITVHHTQTLTKSDVKTIDGINVTTTARTLFDLAGTSISDDDLAHALANAEYRDRSTRTKLKRIAKRLQGHRGSARVRRLLGDDDVVITRSWLERRMRALLTSADLPLPKGNAKVLGRRRDFVWHDQRVVVEVDGWQGHGHRSAFEADRIRDAELTAAGWRVLRFSYTRLRDDPLWVIARLAATLAL